MSRKMSENQLNSLYGISKEEYTCEEAMIVLGHTKRIQQTCTGRGSRSTEDIISGDLEGTWDLLNTWKKESAVMPLEEFMLLPVAKEPAPSRRTALKVRKAARVAAHRLALAAAQEAHAARDAARKIAQEAYGKSSSVARQARGTSRNIA